MGLYSNGSLLLPLGISPTVAIGVMAGGSPGRGGDVVDIVSAAIGNGELGAVDVHKHFPLHWAIRKSTGVAYERASTQPYLLFQELLVRRRSEKREDSQELKDHRSHSLQRERSFI